MIPTRRKRPRLCGAGPGGVAATVPLALVLGTQRNRLMKDLQPRPAMSSRREWLATSASLLAVAACSRGSRTAISSNVAPGSSAAGEGRDIALLMQLATVPGMAIA